MISIILLTKNEMIHLPRLINNLIKVSNDICVVDSFSSDGSFEFLNQNSHVNVIQNKWIDYSSQFNFGLDNFNFKNNWIMRIDADEVLSKDLCDYIINDLQNEKVNGISINRGVYFMGKRLMWGGYRKVKLLRLFKKGLARLESRKMDEHIVVQGTTIHKNFYVFDINLNGIAWWSKKHLSYAIRETEDYLGKTNILAEDIGVAKNIRTFKNWYNYSPLFVRVFMYGFFRLILRGGLLDGRGVLFHLLQGVWYRLIVDLIIFEMNFKKESIKDLKKRFNNELEKL